MGIDEDDLELGIEVFLLPHLLRITEVVLPARRRAHIPYTYISSIPFLANIPLSTSRPRPSYSQPPSTSTSTFAISSTPSSPRTKTRSSRTNRSRSHGHIYILSYPMYVQSCKGILHFVDFDFDREEEDKDGEGRHSHVRVRVRRMDSYVLYFPRLRWILISVICSIILDC